MLGICNLYQTHPLVLTAQTHPMKNYLSNAGFSHYISWNVRFLHRLIPTIHPTYKILCPTYYYLGSRWVDIFWFNLTTCLGTQVILLDTLKNYLGFIKQPF